MGDKQKPKEKKPRTTKTPAELEAAHSAKIEQLVNTIDKRLGQVAKAVGSKKYDIGDDRKTFVMVHLEQALDAALEVMQGKVKTATQFKLP